MLVLQHISHSIGDKKVLQDISLSAKRGEIVGLMGPNGAGKTSLLKIINQIFLQQEGTVFIDNQPIIPSNLLHVGYIPEERGLYLNQSVESNLLFFAQLKGMNKKEAKKQVDYWLTKINLIQEKKTKLKTLSKGNQQRIQFINALVHQPDLLVLDEPFSGFDPVVEEENIQILKELKQQGKAIILSTHRMDNIHELCDRVYMIHQSKLVLEGSIEEIRNKYSNPKIIVTGHGPFSGADFIEEIAKTKKATYVVSNGDSIHELLKTVLEENEVLVCDTQELSFRDIFLQLVGE